MTEASLPRIDPADAVADRPGANAPRCTVDVARSMEHMMQAVAIRAVVYMGEQQCPYGEEFDWDRRGILEESQSRPATNPHGDE